MEFRSFASTIVLAYLLGSIPFAFLVARAVYGQDLRGQGTGNVGTFNFIRVTGNVPLGIVVLLLDLGKGFLGMLWLARNAPISLQLCAALGLVLGHIFPFWLRFRGGRGLATLGGVFLYLHPPVPVVWGVLFGICYALLGSHILATVLALILVHPLIAILFSAKILFVSIPTTFVVILKYVGRIRSEFKNRSDP